jgi:thymidylate kinase
MYAVRSVMLARERMILALRMSARAERGEVVLCDRFPSQVVGAANSPRLVACGASSFTGRLYDSLVSLEGRIYEAIPPPDTVIRLTVPLEDAVRRNEDRIKAGKEAEDYVRQRHARAGLLTYPGVHELILDTAGDFAETTRQARRLVWTALANGA